MADFIKGIGSSAYGFAIGDSEVQKMFLGETKIYDKVSYDAEIEYLYCSGSPYINTGIILTSDTVKISTEFCIIANVPVARSQTLIVSIPNAGVQVYLYEDDVYNQGAVIPVANGQKYTFETITTSTKRQIRIKDGNWNIQNFSRSITDNASIYILGCSTINSLTSKFCWCKIYKNDIIVRDYIPVRVGTTGYMYDKVSGQLFGNQGTGSFILGPDVQ